MNFNLMPSLKHIALVKLIIPLWNQHDIRHLVEGSSTQCYTYDNMLGSRDWELEEKKVAEKVQKLLLPESLKKDILNFIRPIGLEILKWETYKRPNFYNHLPAELCWTPQGTVDQRKTAELLIMNENILLVKRYKIACIHCLEDKIKELWNSVPERMKLSFCKHYDIFKLEPDLVYFWSCVIKGEFNKLNDRNEVNTSGELSLCQLAFEYSVACENKAAAEYFLQKLNPREKDESFANIVGMIRNKRYKIRTSILPKKNEINDAEIWCFLLSQMNREQQVKVFESNPCAVLSCLLDWPWQSLFIEVANCMWDFLSEKEYEQLLDLILDKTRNGYKDCNYHKVFAEFWQQSPDNYKKYAIDRFDWIFLHYLFDTEDKEKCMLIFKNATVKEREKIIFCFEVQDACLDLLRKNKWDFLKFFVKECITSEDMMYEFRGQFQMCIVNEQTSDQTKIKMLAKFYLWRKLVYEGDLFK